MSRRCNRCRVFEASVCRCDLVTGRDDLLNTVLRHLFAWII